VGAISNPWLGIPVEDYLGHMGSPEVDQLSVLDRLARLALATFRPRDVLVLGCATGNGLEHVDPKVTRRVTGVDINPQYLREIRRRFPDPRFKLVLQCQDVMAQTFPPDAYHLVHCALLLEYVDWPRLLSKLVGTIRIGGALSVVLQLPSSAPAVTETRFKSLRRLEALFHFVDPASLILHARSLGLEVVLQWTEPLPQGKAFAVLYLGRGA
jgi:SAM-dependent methyltransferase